MKLFKKKTDLVDVSKSNRNIVKYLGVCKSEQIIQKFLEHTNKTKNSRNIFKLNKIENHS